jgi:hypothetical protein
MLCAAAAAAMIWIAFAAAQEKRPFTADRHKALKIACAGCHQEAKPEKAAPAEACLKCHQSLDGVAERTKNLKPNPHKNHLTEGSDVECTQCHLGHKADTLICNQCHGEITFEKQQPETK